MGRVSRSESEEAILQPEKEVGQVDIVGRSGSGWKIETRKGWNGSKKSVIFKVKKYFFYFWEVKKKN